MWNCLEFHIYFILTIGSHSYWIKIYILCEYFLKFWKIQQLKHMLFHRQCRYYSLNSIRYFKFLNRQLLRQWRQWGAVLRTILLVYRRRGFSSKWYSDGETCGKSPIISTPSSQVTPNQDNQVLDIFYTENPVLLLVFLFFNCCYHKN